MPAPPVARVRAMLATGAAALLAVPLLASCASGGSSADPTWKPKPSFSGEGYAPGNQQPDTQDPSSSSPSGSPKSSTPTQQSDPSVVATKLTTPTAVTILPDNTALVGERTTGRIVRVQPEAGRPVQTVRTIPGLSTAGGGGLLDLAISPNYSQDNLLFAYITTPTDNRVVAFTLTGPITAVLTGIPRGSADNTGRIAFAPDGDLLVGTSDAGRPALAANPTSLAGKVLRVTDIGKPAAGNPKAGSAVYASGFKRTDGLCVDPDTGTAFQTAAIGTSGSADPVNQVVAGATYGWPTTVSATEQPLAHLPATSRSPGGCAVLSNVLYETSRDGTSLLAAPIKSAASGNAVTLGAFSVSLRNKYGRLLTVVAAADGALWITTTNRDGHGKPVAADERVLRIVPSGGGTTDSPL